jgi:hypothetical protein
MASFREDGRTSSLKINTSSNYASSQAQEEYYRTYRQRYNALSALELHTIGKIQHLWTLCTLQLKVAQQLFALSAMLDFDDDEDFMMMMLMHVHHCLHAVKFLSSLDNLLMVITPDQVIPHLVPANWNRTFDLLHPGWCHEKTHFLVAQLWELYHLLEFPAMFLLSNRGHYASSEEAFILMLTKLATGDTNLVLADTFSYLGDGMVSLIYRFMISILDNKARGILHDSAGCLWCWVHLFPDFAEIIKNKLNTLVILITRVG